MDVRAQEEEWHGRFFASEEEAGTLNYEPDHVVTVSEVTGQLPATLEEEKRLLAEREAEEYRALLMDSKTFRKIRREKSITRSAKVLIAVVTVFIALAGAVGMAFFFSAFRGVPVFSVAVLPAAISAFVFLFSSAGFFFTRGWTEKLAGIAFTISGVFLMLLLSGVVTI